MQEIKAIIQPFMLSQVIDALKEIHDMPGVTVSEVKGFGRGRAANTSNGVTEWGVMFVPKVKLETVVRDEMVDEIVTAIAKNAHTGNVGDGKIFVYPVCRIVKIRTQETGEGAL